MNKKVLFFSYISCLILLCSCLVIAAEEEKLLVTEINWRKINDIKKLAEYAENTDLAFQLAAVRQARRLLSCKKVPPYDEFIDSGIIPTLVKFMDSKNTTLQFDVTWILAHIASGNLEQTAAIVEADTIPHFINLLNSPNTEIIGQALWGLSHIIDKSPQYRDKCIDAGVIPALVKLANSDSSSIAILRNIAWTLKNMCKHQNSNDLVPLKIIEEILPIFAKFVKKEDSLIIYETLSGIANCGNGSNSRIQKIIDYPNIVEDVIPFQKNSNSKIQDSAFNVVKVISNGNNQQKQILLDNEILKPMKTLIRSPNKHIKKSILSILENLAAGTQQQSEIVFDAKLIHEIIKLLNYNDYQIRIHATKVIASGSRHPKTAKSLIKHKIISKLCKILKHSMETDEDIIVALKALKNVVKHSENYNDTVYQEINDASGISLFSKFNHKNAVIKNLTDEIIDFITDYESTINEK